MPDRKTDPPPSTNRPAKTEGVRLTATNRLALYAAKRYTNSDLEEKFKVRIPFDVYFQDPLVAAANAEMAFDGDCVVPWEPGIGDGPTSARFAVVDYDHHTETLTPPAKWNPTNDTFVTPAGAPLDRSAVGRGAVDELQFHQVNVWAIAQRALDFFEGGFGLGRSISWAFEGNRLIIVPHAGPGTNAFYDRVSHSLQFYYYDVPEGRHYTCTSSDIVTHEFGHAVLDGIRPHYAETVLHETAAFHEFVGDFSAILITLRNNEFRKRLIQETEGDLSRESTLSGIAEQFGKDVRNRPYLRSALSTLTMAGIAGLKFHDASQVLTAAMFDILIAVSRHYVEKREKTAPQAFWHTVDLMQPLAVQPLDLLPPVDVSFRDYALAVVRANEIANPMDPDNFRGMMFDAFIKRGILTEADREEQKRPHHVFERLDVDVFHDIESIGGSRAGAYRFLDDNRRKLCIPPNADVVVSDLSASQKFTRQARRLPKQVLLQYIWREDVVLDGPQFGRFNGETTQMLCGGTLALDQNGEVLHWARKPGTQYLGDSKSAKAEQEKGVARLAGFLEGLAALIREDEIGKEIGGEKGLVPSSTPQVIARTVAGAVRFELSPHFGIEDDEADEQGGRRWTISS